MFWKKLGFVFLVFFFVFGTLITMGQQPVMAKELKLIASTYIPPVYKDIFPIIQRYIDYINEHGKGKVHLDFYHSGTLLPAEQTMPGLM